MTKNNILKYMKSSNRMLPIFIPSYMRAGKSAAMRRVFIHFNSKDLKNITMVVRPEEYDEYCDAYPDINILKLTGDINGLASTRQWIVDYATKQGIPYILDMDDDIFQVRALYKDTNKHGLECSRLFTIDDGILDLYPSIFRAASKVAVEVMKTHKDALYGNIRRRRFSDKKSYHRTKYVLQGGSTPRQFTFVNIKGLYDSNIQRDMVFDPHGDDIGFAAVVLAKGKKCFSIPSFTYGYIDEKCDSVIRTPETSKRLHKYEYDVLQQYPIKDYLKTTFKDAEGNYMWGDIDWRKYHKLNNTKIESVLWTKGDLINV